MKHTRCLLTFAAIAFSLLSLLPTLDCLHEVHEYSISGLEDARVNSVRVAPSSTWDFHSETNDGYIYFGVVQLAFFGGLAVVLASLNMMYEETKRK